MNDNKIKFADNFFNTRLYLQAMKRLKVTGLVFLICLNILSIFLVFADNLGSTYIRFIQAHSSVYSMMTLIIFIAVPLMTLILFHYLTTRNGSDFYHSVATKRRAVFFSFVAAIITWALIIIVSFTALTTIAYALVSDFCYINLGNIIIYAFNIFISCILVATVFALGCSITGTIFSNIVASTCILVLPRIIITALAYMVASESAILSTNGMALLTRYSCNMPFALFLDTSNPFSGMGGYDYSTIKGISSIGFPTFYTFALAIIYLLIGWKMYEKRPSETAGKAASSSKIQYCVRMVIGYLVTLFIVLFMYGPIVKNRFYIEDYLLVMLIIFLVATLLMFLYELITSKQIKSACKALLHSPILLVMDAITIGILLLANSYTLNNVPDASDVDYIKVDISYIEQIKKEVDPSSPSSALYNDCNASYYDYYSDSIYYYDDSSFNYILDKLSDVEITDEDAINLATDGLAEYTRCLKDDPDASFDMYHISYTEAMKSSLSYELCITYGTGISEVTRYVRFTQEDGEAIINALLNSDSADNILSSLPEYDDFGTYVLRQGITDEQIMEVYTLFREELTNVSMVDYLKTTMSSHTVCTLDLYNYENGLLTTTQFYLTNATPKAMALYMNYYNEQNEKGFDEKLANVLNDSYKYFAYASAYIYDYAEGQTHSATGRDFSASSNILLANLNSVKNELASPIPTDFANEFNPETHYLCFICVDLFERYRRYSSELDDTVITHEEYKGSSGYYFLLDKNYDINEFLNKFPNGPYHMNIFIP